MMAVTTSILPADLGSTTSRSPLRPKSITSTPTNTLRRKGSFIRLADSSEESPSSHESIFEAFCFSASEASSHHAEIVDIPSRIPRPIKKNDENSRKVSPSNFMDTIHFRYGNGTALDTITEQKSYTTIRSKARTKSADNSPSIPFLCHRDSFIISKTPRRQISFSLDDIEEIKKSYHDACTVIEQELCKPLLAPEVYAEPKVPVQAPPDRPPTPPGLPSWTEAQVLAIPRRRQSQQPQAPRQSRVRRFFNLSGAVASPQGQPRERNRTASEPVPGRTAPRFRPPKSVYGAIDQHPFAKAPIAKIQSDAPSAISKPRKRLQKEQRVRFTPSATARDSEANMLQAAIESTTAAAPHPFEPFTATTVLLPPQKICPHRTPSGSATATPEKVKAITVVEPATIRSPLPYHRDDTSFPPPDLGIFRSDSPTPPTQAELDSLCVLESPRERPASVTSTTFLMSGALRAPTPPPLTPQSEIPAPIKEKWCWRCTLRSAVGKLDDWWTKSAGCICFVCCGFDIDDDGNVSGGTSHSPNVRRGYGSEMSGPRMVVLNQTPAVIL